LAEIGRSPQDLSGKRSLYKCLQRLVFQDLDREVPEALGQSDDACPAMFKWLEAEPSSLPWSFFFFALETPQKQVPN
jgi:hypothetical protein